MQAIELGNQPDFFIFNKYRPKSYNFNDYLAEFSTFTKHIKAAVPNSPTFMGPSNGGFAGVKTIAMVPVTTFGTPNDLKKLLEQEGSVLGIVSQHAYTGGSTKCGDNPKPGFLLLPSSVAQDPQGSIPYVAVTKADNKPYRMAEMNSIMCSGEPGISDAFEASLWVSDILFEYAKLGMAGVNIHTNTWNTIHGWDIYGAFLFNVPENQYRASNTEATPPKDVQFPATYTLKKVLPLYYGLLLFAESTANQGKQLPTRLTTSVNLKAWSTLDPSTGSVRITIINKDLKASGTVKLIVPGYATGTVKRLLAPSFSAQEGITFGGQTFDGSKDGKLVGKQHVEQIKATNDTFEVAIEPTSAFLVTLKK